MKATDQPILPNYGGANVRGIVPAILGPKGAPKPAWLPDAAHVAKQTVLMVIDGLGWEQLQDNLQVVPTMASLAAQRLTTVAPTTTATALTSISTGLTPGEHGLVGYRMHLSGDIVNVLRWHGAKGDVRRQFPPRDIQSFAPFMGESPTVITRAELEQSSFTEAHLRGGVMRGWRSASSIAVEIGAQLRSGVPFVYAYYDGVDKIAHERGFGPYYQSELQTVDRLVRDVIGQLPPQTVLLVTADHGQVMVGNNEIQPDPEVLRCTKMMSGEGRFRWFHARPGAHADLLQAAQAAHGHHAWAVSAQEMIEARWFGPVVSPPVAARLGDVALVARDPISFIDPHDSGPYALVCRHGSLTSAEMYVPLLVATCDDAT